MWYLFIHHRLGLSNDPASHLFSGSQCKFPFTMQFSFLDKSDALIAISACDEDVSFELIYIADQEDSNEQK